MLAVIDGNDGLSRQGGIKDSWPWIDIQRCTKHQLEKLSTYAPKWRYEESEADYYSVLSMPTVKRRLGRPGNDLNVGGGRIALR